MLWVYRALAITALITRVIIIHDNVQRIRSERKLKKEWKELERKRDASKRDNHPRF